MIGLLIELVLLVIEVVIVYYFAGLDPSLIQDLQDALSKWLDEAVKD